MLAFTPCPIMVSLVSSSFVLALMWALRGQGSPFSLDQLCLLAGDRHMELGDSYLP